MTNILSVDNLFLNQLGLPFFKSHLYNGLNVSNDSFYLLQITTILVFPMLLSLLDIKVWSP